MALELAALVAVVLLVLVMYQIKNRHFYKAIEQFPGPPALPLLGNSWQIYQCNFEQMTLLKWLREEYGQIFRAWLGPTPFIFVSKPEDVEAVLSNMKNITKGNPYAFLEPWLGDGLLLSTGAKWHARRKLLTPTFHFKILEQFMEVFDRNGRILLQQLEKKSEKKEIFDIFGPISLCALDIICETAMGSKVDAQLNVHSHYVAAVKAACRGLYLRTMKQAWLKWETTFRMAECGKAFFKAIDVIHGKTHEVIQSRKEERLKEKQTEYSAEDDFGVKRRTAFLDQLLDSKAEGANITDEDIREEVDTFMFEGHDTTTASMAFTLFSLATNPDIQEKVYQEQKEIFGDSDRAMTMKDISEMKYLDRVIKESLRLYPSVPLFLRTVTSDITLKDGKVVPTGCTIGVSAHCMGTNPEVWPNPEIFDPDRFLPEASEGRHPYAYVPFSAGPRNCIGQKFAMLEMKSTIAKVVRNFRIYPARAAAESMIVVAEVILKAQGGLLVRVEKRV